MRIKILPVILLLPFFAFSQTAAERSKIASFSNKESNNQLARELRTEDQQKEIRLSKFLKNNPVFSKTSPKDGVGTIELIDVLPSGEKIYAKTYNAGAAITARATSLYKDGSLGVNIQGQNMLVGVWDAGSARYSHQEFVIDGISKVWLMDGSLSDVHATHVAGTIAAQGIQSAARGIAFNSSINSYNWTGDLAEMLTEASAGLLMSNHSYGIGALSSIWFYGAYDSRARQMDQICFNNPYYLPVVAAGNDRNDTKDPGLTQNANKAGYDLVQGHANAKNVLTVAAVTQVTKYNDPSSVVMSSFSSWGPSDDGRIKPEISMKGVNVRSTTDVSDTSYGSMSGTSMASPGVTGVVTLLQQYYNQLYSNYMRAASVKGLILHTADEAGLFSGPDYEFGWGLINAENSAKLLRDKNLSASRSILEENVLANSTTYSKTISASGGAPLKISISWTDPNFPSSNSGTVDPATKYLVNDLDIKVMSSTGTTYYPWKLQGMADPAAIATRNSTNDVDNFERIDIENPSGTYTITVSHKGTLTGGNQNYTLIASSDNLNVLAVDSYAKLGDDLSLYPNPAKEELFIKNNNAVEAKVSIVDNSGRIISQQVIKNGKVNISNLTTGSYILIYSDKSNRETSLKFIKK